MSRDKSAFLPVLIGDPGLLLFNWPPDYPQPYDVGKTEEMGWMGGLRTRACQMLRHINIVSEFSEFCLDIEWRFTTATLLIFDL